MNAQLMLPIFSPDILSEESIRLARSIRAERTLKGYASDWGMFVTWCAENARIPLPAAGETVDRYITDFLMRGRRIKTARRHLSAILFHHRQAGYETLCLRQAHMIVSGAQRLRGEQPQQKAPVTVEQLRGMVCLIDRPEPYRSRDRALLVFGFATALRRCSIVALDLEDVEFEDRGMVVQVQREKQDQTGVGRRIGIPWGKSDDTCPVEALRRWLTWRGTQPGPLFWGFRNGPAAVHRMHANTVAEIVKRAIRSVGLDPARYGSHSLRAGFVTAALEAGVGEILTARHTGHKALASLKLYMRSEDPFEGNACAAVGL